jgi:hypothetical protein
MRNTLILGCYFGLAGFAVNWLVVKIHQTWKRVKTQDAIERLDNAVPSMKFYTPDHGSR